MSEPEAIHPRAGAPGRLEAVLFDLDGVVTDTARAHAAAWKRLFDEFLRTRADERREEFRPFDPERDYRVYVDGKPRNDGVRSFLRSRGIELPEGTPEDPPDADTVAGLGNRKQQYFRGWLRDHQVQTYPGTMRLLHELHAAGVKTALFSSSRNTEDVLRNAGALDLFAVRVDGNDLRALDLPGKPDPAMLREAASRLGVPPGRAAVIEDAIAGVEAGVRGGFGLVIGVDRGDDGEGLKRAGAHLVVGDLSELSVSETHGLVVRTLDSLPAVWDREGEVRARLSEKSPLVFLDYDGTLTPIVEDHTMAFLAGEMRAAIADLATRCPVAIVSGRDLAMLRRLVALDTVYLAGSHGFEIAGPGGSIDALEKGSEFLPELDAVEAALRTRLAGIEGHSVERKRFSVAVHYRQVAEADVDRVDSVVEETIAEHPRLERGYGKKVFELRPGIDWNKGRAVLWLLERLGLDGMDVVPIYVGDDLTDEDAFRALSGRGLTVVVRDGESRPTAAEYTVADVAEVKRFLEMLTAVAARIAAPEGDGE